MARLPQKTDYDIKVDGIGTFRIARRKMSDEILIQRYYAEYAGGVEPTAWLATLAEYLSTYRGLVVTAPEGFDIDNLDPLDDETYKKLGSVFTAIREQEERFRGRFTAPSKGAGEVDGTDSRPLVQEDLPTPTESSSIP
ncbi:hypothetical protein fHeYen801_015 [Yersinia phage fHe-Yen8-01]|nr:hypothetical protein fHeYen801_015 [Yersinia phage fHe-Yen8-01]